MCELRLSPGATNALARDMDEAARKLREFAAALERRPSPLLGRTASERVREARRAALLRRPAC